MEAHKRSFTKLDSKNQKGFEIKKKKRANLRKRKLSALIVG